MPEWPRTWTKRVAGRLARRSLTRSMSGMLAFAFQSLGKHADGVRAVGVNDEVRPISDTVSSTRSIAVSSAMLLVPWPNVR